jgi:hypothetical protein
LLFSAIKISVETFRQELRRGHLLGISAIFPILSENWAKWRAWVFRPMRMRRFAESRDHIAILCLSSYAMLAVGIYLFIYRF